MANSLILYGLPLHEKIRVIFLFSERELSGFKNSKNTRNMFNLSLHGRHEFWQAEKSFYYIFMVIMG